MTLAVVTLIRNGSSVTRRSSFAYDSGTGLLTQEGAAFGTAVGSPLHLKTHARATGRSWLRGISI